MGYLSFIYGTLEIVRGPTGFLRSHNLLRLTLSVLYAIFFSGFLRRLIRARNPDSWRYLTVGLVFAAYIWIGFSYVLPEEQFHFFEYGLLGWLFMIAVEGHIGYNWMAFLLSAVLSGTAGWLDETLQGLTPSRHYDIHDIMLDGASAILGLFLYASMHVKRLPEKG